MAATIVQTATGNLTTKIPGGDLGPGTRMVLQLSVTFPSPLTAGNSIAFAVSGGVVQAGGAISFGPLAPGVTSAAGGGLPARTYYVAVTYVDTSGHESVLGSEVSISVPAGQLLTVSPPNNPNFSGSNVPGVSGWNVYVGTVSGGETKQNGSLLAINTTWTEPSSGISTGALPPSAPLWDSAGNVYKTAFFQPTNYGGAQYGGECMGILYSTGIVGGATTLNFFCVGYNPNPFFDVTAFLNIVAGELADWNPVSTVDSGVVQQQNSTHPLSISTLNHAGSPVVSDFQTQTQTVAGVTDLWTGSANLWLAAATADSTGGSYWPPQPTLSNGGVYALIDKITPSGSPPLYFWWNQPVRKRIHCFVMT